NRYQPHPQTLPPLLPPHHELSPQGWPQSLPPIPPRHDHHTPAQRSHDRHVPSRPCQRRRSDRRSDTARSRRPYPPPIIALVSTRALTSAAPHRLDRSFHPHTFRRPFRPLVPTARTFRRRSEPPHPARDRFRTAPTTFTHRRFHRPFRRARYRRPSRRPFTPPVRRTLPVPQSPFRAIFRAAAFARLSAAPLSAPIPRRPVPPPVSAPFRPHPSTAADISVRPFHRPFRRPFPPPYPPAVRATRSATPPESSEPPISRRSFASSFSAALSIAALPGTPDPPFACPVTRSVYRPLSVASMFHRIIPLRSSRAHFRSRPFLPVYVAHYITVRTLPIPRPLLFLPPNPSSNPQCPQVGGAEENRPESAPIRAMRFPVTVILSRAHRLTLRDTALPVPTVPSASSDALFLTRSFHCAHLLRRTIIFRRPTSNSRIDLDSAPGPLLYLRVPCSPVSAAHIPAALIPPSAFRPRIRRAAHFRPPVPDLHHSARHHIRRPFCPPVSAAHSAALSAAPFRPPVPAAPFRAPFIFRRPFRPPIPPPLHTRAFIIRTRPLSAVPFRIYIYAHYRSTCPHSVPDPNIRRTIIHYRARPSFMTQPIYRRIHVLQPFRRPFRLYPVSTLYGPPGPKFMYCSREREHRLSFRTVPATIVCRLHAPISLGPASFRPPHIRRRPILRSPDPIPAPRRFRRHPASTQSGTARSESPPVPRPIRRPSAEHSPAHPAARFPSAPFPPAHNCGPPHFTKSAAHSSAPHLSTISPPGPFSGARFRRPFPSAARLHPRPVSAGPFRATAPIARTAGPFRPGHSEPPVLRAQFQTEAHSAVPFRPPHSAAISAARSRHMPVPPPVLPPIQPPVGRLGWTMCYVLHHFPVPFSINKA
ncbi:hypothetical protein C7M84_023159, partial [Penaeus vannamei]